MRWWEMAKKGMYFFLNLFENFKLAIQTICKYVHAWKDEDGQKNYWEISTKIVFKRSLAIFVVNVFQLKLLKS